MTTPKWWEPIKGKKGRVIFVESNETTPTVFMHYVSESTEKYKLDSDTCAMMPHHMYRAFLTKKRSPPLRPSDDWERRVRLVLE